MKFLSYEEEKNLTNSELLEYYKKIQKEFNKPILNPADKGRQIFHPIYKNIVKSMRNFDLTIDGKIELLKNQPAIFVVNHSNSHDFPIAAEIIKRHFYILADFTMKKTWVNIPNELNGVIYVDRLNKKSKLEAKEQMIKLLLNGKNVLLFPEGTWNLTPSKPLLPLNWGAIDLAKITNCPIVPIVIDYRYNESTNKLECNSKIGKPIYMHYYSDKQQELYKLEEIMATLKWSIWEKLGEEKRDKIDIDYHNKYVNFCLNEYKNFDLEYENSVILDSSLDKQKFKSKTLFNR